VAARQPRDLDSHQHFWRYDAQEYDWIGDDLAAPADFLPADLARETACRATRW
jgi:L-fuconolactonase